MQLVSFKGKFTTDRILSALSFFFSLRPWVRAALASSYSLGDTPSCPPAPSSRTPSHPGVVPSVLAHPRTPGDPTVLLLAHPSLPVVREARRSQPPASAPSLLGSLAPPDLCLQNGRPSATTAPTATASI
ncbi:hypothetical protein PF008_g16903 [Phytophthora fragariae]|uniref:Uncharacterized protein n=1 Tax=Phytophthora fragariae TaxID=53985 RepID=A0A6G0RB72_9STRA|nr:hypothetical protein PF008_g16903 [Phytophthora fragariae]